jgi:hypothetical protein
MNEVLDILLLIGALAVASVWIVAVFCFVIYTVGGHDE